MIKPYFCNWISHGNRSLMMSLLQKEKLGTCLQLKNHLSMHCSLNRLSFTKRNQLMDCLASNTKINSNRIHNRNISNTKVIKEKSDLNDKVQYKDSLLAKRNRNASKRERILWYRKQFLLFNLQLFGFVAFVITVCWARPDQRKYMNNRAPAIGKFVDLVLGPSDEDIPEIDKIKSTDESPKKESNANNKD